MKKAIILEKREGETPLQALERFRSGHKKYQGEKMTYAGRLDPMVSGLMLVLAGDGVKEKEKYLGLSKEYEFEILFGFATDTHDILGKISNSQAIDGLGKEDVRQGMRAFVGEFEQSYPVYSSPNIKRARRGEAPPARSHKVRIRALRFSGFRRISGRVLMQDIARRIGNVEGDFRQKEILRIWQTHLKNHRNERFLIGKFFVQCGSGMYVRQLVHDLGQQLRVPALAYRIQRTKIGKFAKITQWAHKTS